MNRRFGTPADSPSRYRVPGACDTEDNLDPNDPLDPGEQLFRWGPSPGWADIHSWFPSDQYTDVPDGRHPVVYRLSVSGACQAGPREH